MIPHNRRANIVASGYFLNFIIQPCYHWRILLLTIIEWNYILWVTFVLNLSLYSGWTIIYLTSCIIKELSCDHSIREPKLYRVTYLVLQFWYFTIEVTTGNKYQVKEHSLGYFCVKFYTFIQWGTRV